MQLGVGGGNRTDDSGRNAFPEPAAALDELRRSISDQTMKRSQSIKIGISSSSVSCCCAAGSSELLGSMGGGC